MIEGFLSFHYEAIHELFGATLIRKIDAVTKKMMFIPIILEIDYGTDQVQLLVQHLTNI